MLTPHVMTTPIITKADGGWQVRGGTIWLDPEMMTPYAFYRFWRLRVADDDVVALPERSSFKSCGEIRARRRGYRRPHLNVPRRET